MDTAQYKKELLYRKANAKGIVKNYISKAACLFLVNKDNLVFMELKKTDEILSSSKQANEKVFKKRVFPSHLNTIFKKLKSDNSPYYVFIDDDWKYCGSFIIPSLCFLNEEFMFGDKIINDILFISADLKRTISFDYYEVNGVYCIDVTRTISI